MGIIEFSSGLHLNIMMNNSNSNANLLAGKSFGIQMRVISLEMLKWWVSCCVGLYICLWEWCLLLCPYHIDYKHTEVYLRMLMPEASQAGICNCNPQYSVVCNYLSLPEIPASGNKVHIWRYILWGLNKMADLLQLIYSNDFLFTKKYWYCGLNVSEHCSGRSDSS